jgi:hypothetical protein
LGKYQRRRKATSCRRLKKRKGATIRVVGRFGQVGKGSLHPWRDVGVVWETRESKPQPRRGSTCYEKPSCNLWEVATTRGGLRLGFMWLDLGRRGCHRSLGVSTYKEEQPQSRGQLQVYWQSLRVVQGLLQVYIRLRKRVVTTTLYNIICGLLRAVTTGFRQPLKVFIVREKKGPVITL